MRVRAAITTLNYTAAVAELSTDRRVVDGSVSRWSPALCGVFQFSSLADVSLPLMRGRGSALMHRPDGQSGWTIDWALSVGNGGLQHRKPSRPHTSYYGRRLLTDCASFSGWCCSCCCSRRLQRFATSRLEHTAVFHCCSGKLAPTTGKQFTGELYGGTQCST